MGVKPIAVIVLLQFLKKRESLSWKTFKWGIEIHIHGDAWRRRLFHADFFLLFIAMAGLTNPFDFFNRFFAWEMETLPFNMTIALFT